MSEDAEFFNVHAAEPVGEEPIILGEAPPSDFAAAPILLGEPPADAPIVLGAPDEMPPPEEPTGPTPMQKWNEEWQETLKTRKEEENTKKAEIVEASRVALAAFQAGSTPLQVCPPKLPTRSSPSSQDDKESRRRASQTRSY